jgi:hypothetical protein
MADNTTNNGRNESQAFAKTAPAATAEKSPVRSKAGAAQPASVTTRGQKYVSPEGRHSQQTHRRAEERATADGHTSEKEQHDHDRSAVTAEINRLEAAKVSQRTQNTRGATPKA